MVVISSGSDMICYTFREDRLTVTIRFIYRPDEELHELYLGERSFHTVTCYDDAVPLVSTPALKKLSGEPALHHTWRCHHHTRADVIKMVHALEENITSDLIPLNILK